MTNDYFFLKNNIDKTEQYVMECFSAGSLRKARPTWFELVVSLSKIYFELFPLSLISAHWKYTHLGREVMAYLSDHPPNIGGKETQVLFSL